MRVGIDASRAFMEDPTGTERYSFEIISRLIALPEAREHEWILYTRKSQIPNPKIQIHSTSSGSRVNRGTSSNVQMIQIPNKYLWTQFGLAARTWIDRLDVLWVPAHTLPLLRRGFGGLGRSLKTVVTIHGIEYEWLPAYENWLQRWYLPLSTKYAVLGAKKIIAVSEFTRRQLMERLGARGDKISVIYEGVSESVRAEEFKSISVLKKFSLKAKKYLLFVGTIQPRKNLERLIGAFYKLKANSYKLVIAGKWGWGYEKLQDVKDKNIIFTGYVDDQERDVLLQNALIYVQPSITEGFGLPVLEAMAAGVSVVSSDGGALAEVIGEAGMLFDPLDVRQISHSLSLVIHSHSLREELINKGRKRAGEFTWEKATRETYNILTNFT